MLKPLAGGPRLPSLKCTSAFAPTQQQTIACGVWGFNRNGVLKLGNGKIEVVWYGSGLIIWSSLTNRQVVLKFVLWRHKLQLFVFFFFVVVLLSNKLSTHNCCNALLLAGNLSPGQQQQTAGGNPQSPGSSPRRGRQLAGVAPSPLVLQHHHLQQQVHKPPHIVGSFPSPHNHTHTGEKSPHPPGNH